MATPDHNGAQMVTARARVAAAGRVWRIVGSTGHRVECYIRPSSKRQWTVIVTFGSETMLTETHATEGLAHARAAALGDGLLRRGWKQA